ncbi:MAG: S9 family peptidase [Caldilineaceae bacterium]
MSTPTLTFTPPSAPPRPTRVEMHGDELIDNYFWLRERDNPAVLAYLQAENQYTAAIMQPTEALQEKLYQEMRDRLQQTDLSVPEQIDGYFYYMRTQAGQQYPIYCRKAQSLDAPEEILLDQNELAVGQPFCAIGNFKVSPDGRLLAYALDTAGDEVYTLYIKDLTSGALLPERMDNTYYGLEWTNDNRALYYTVLDEAKRPYQLFRHHLGDDVTRDQLIYQEPDQRFNITLSKSKSQAYLFVNLESSMTSEVWFIPADQATATPQVVELRRQGVEYTVTHHDTRFFITTNDQARNFRVMTAPVANPGKAQWHEFIPHRENVMVNSTEAFRRHLVVFEREGGLRQIRIIDLTNSQEHRVDFPDQVYTFRPEHNPEFDSNLLRFTYMSLITPNSVFDYNMDTRTFDLKKREEILGGYDPAHYHTARLWATAPDGAQVPISLVHRKDLHLDGNNPTWLNGYGAYGVSREPWFNANIISLLERGFVVALAHIRGGGEMGRRWYEEGKLLHKKNSFTDFIACAEQLIDQGYTSPARLIISGRSAGGLLMGAVTNLRPDLFAGVIAGVPFVDVIHTMADASIPLTVSEYEEWGNPADPTFYAYMNAYSPYDNVTAKAYPNILATAGLNDPRVQYWEPAKWVAKLRALKTDNNRLLLQTNLGAGHSGASGRYDYLREVAFEYAFMLAVLGWSESPSAQSTA